MHARGSGTGWERGFWFVFNRSTNPMCLIDEERRIVDVNDSTLALIKRSRAQVIGSPAVDFIVTGHTHLERAIDMGHGRYYFNSGTWIRLLQFTPQMLENEATFQKVYQVLKDGRMAAIDAARFGGADFVMDQTSAVAIVERNGTVTGSLVHVEGDGKGKPTVKQEFTRR